MTAHQYANNPSTTLAGAVTAASASISVASAAGFPTRGKFTIIIDSEIMLVTGVTGTTWTVTRGHDGTAAAAHNNNATVTQILTVDSFLNANHFDVRFFGAVGDGVTDDTDAVEAASTAAIEAGGTVFFPPGTYIVDTINTIGKGDGTKSLSFKGAGFSSVIKLKNAATIGAMFFIYPATVLSFTVEDLKIDGNSGNNGGDGISCFRVHSNDATFRNVWFVDAVQEAIYHSAGSAAINKRFIVTGCIFNNCGRYAIAAEFVESMIVSNNIAEDCGAGLVSVETSTVGTDTAYDIAIVGNTLHNTGGAIANPSAGAIGVWGVPWDAASIPFSVQKVTIANNVIDGAGDSGIVVGNISSCTITGNVVFGAGAYGIANSDGGGTLGSIGIVISSNIIRDCAIDASNTYSGIFLDRASNCVVTSNLVQDSSSRLKYMVEFTSDCSANVIGLNNYRGSAATAQQSLGGVGNLDLTSLND